MCKLNVHKYVLYIMLQEAQIKSLVVYVVSSLLSQYSTRGISHINIHHYVCTCATVCHDTVVLYINGKGFFCTRLTKMHWSSSGQRWLMVKNKDLSLESHGVGA